MAALECGTSGRRERIDVMVAQSCDGSDETIDVLVTGVLFICDS